MKNKLLLACFALLLARAALAEYPERPIKMVMPFPPGGTVDVLTRLVSSEAAETLGKPLVLEYKPGAGAPVFDFGTAAEIEAIAESLTPARTARRSPPRPPRA
jgi:hypothetical protein